MDKERLLHELLPYRMQAVAILNSALSLRATWGDAPMNIFVNDKLVIEGNLNAFANPAIEAGLMHCRALLEFLGLQMNREGRLGNLKTRRKSDIGIEHFCVADKTPLRMVEPDDALIRYEGGPAEAEMALLSVFQITNKGLAHFTEDFNDHPEHARLIEIASRGIPSLVISHLYTPLGLPAPNYKITVRRRPA